MIVHKAVKLQTMFNSNGLKTEKKKQRGKKKTPMTIVFNHENHKSRRTVIS